MFIIDQLEQGLVGIFEARCGDVEAQCEAIEANVARMREQIQACYQRRYVRSMMISFSAAACCRWLLFDSVC